MAIAAFLFFGAVMGTLAGITLIWPGTFLSLAWRLNPRAYAQMAPLGTSMGISFLGLAIIMAIAGYLWIRRRYWGWLLALIIFALQFLGDLANLLAGEFLKGGLGIVIAGGIVAYLLRPKVRTAFRQDAQKALH
jgi:hypothetical protein